MKPPHSNTLIINSKEIDIICTRLGSEVLELFHSFPNLRILAVQPRGILFAEYLKTILKEKFDFEMIYGKLDPSFYRDDIGSGSKIVIPQISSIEFEIADQPILLIDDVLYMGRTVRAAIEGLLDMGRPKWVKLMVLVNRYMERELPISADFEGLRIDTIPGQRIRVRLDQNAELEISFHNG